VALVQLAALGLGPSGVRSRVAAGRLHRLHRGVYAVHSAPLSDDARVMAAVLASGPGSAASHRSAGALLGLRRSDRPVVDVIAPGRRGRTRAGIRVHRAAALRPGDITRVRHIPCTTVARTLLDLAGCVDARQLDRAIERAETLRVFDLSEIEDVLSGVNRHPGGAPLRSALAIYAPQPAVSRSELERLVISICRRVGMPRPATNVFIPLEGGGCEVDFAWPDERLIVEADGWRYHRTRKAFEDDRRRDQLLALAGWHVLRFTWRQIVEEPAEVARVIAEVRRIGRRRLVK
jgi:hypothetical protein